MQVGRLMVQDVLGNRANRAIDVAPAILPRQPPARRTMHPRRFIEHEPEHWWVVCATPNTQTQLNQLTQAGNTQHITMPHTF